VTVNKPITNGYIPTSIPRKRLDACNQQMRISGTAKKQCLKPETKPAGLNKLRAGSSRVPETALMSWLYRRTISSEVVRSCNHQQTWRIGATSSVSSKLQSADAHMLVPQLIGAIQDYFFNPFWAC
jgi:hypothetical protein